MKYNYHHHKRKRDIEFNKCKYLAQFVYIPQFIYILFNAILSFLYTTKKRHSYRLHSVNYYKNHDLKYTGRGLSPKSSRSYYTYYSDSDSDSDSKSKYE